VDVLLERDAKIQVKQGDRVRGGASVLALLPVAPVAGSDPGRRAGSSLRMDEPATTRRGLDRPRGKMRKGMYLLPSLFTSANMAAGFYAILQTITSSATEPWHLDFAAKAIGLPCSLMGSMAGSRE